MTPLETARLRLRPLALADADWILTLLNDPAFLAHIGDKGARDRDGARRYLAEGPLAMYAAHGHGLWAVEDRADGAPLGMCGLLQRPTLAHPDLGYALLPAARGRGVATEACRATLAWASADPGRARRFATVLALVAPGNAASIAVLEKLGFRAAGRGAHGADPAVEVYALNRPGSGSDR